MRYLGVPLIYRKLGSTDYQPLIAKITSGISSWTSKYLSFAGRLQLIDSILNNMIHYWMSVFILPKMVIKAIERIYCSFLWNGGGTDPVRGAKVSWVNLCQPKTERGLRLRNLGFWNKASISRQISLLFQESGSLWIAWIKINLLKMRSFLLVKPNSSSSWSWKKLLKLRNLIKPMTRFVLGKGDKILFWIDQWHPKGPLLSVYSQRTLFGSDICTTTFLSQIINNGEWIWPPARSPEMLEIQSSAAGLRPSTQPDSIFWIPSNSGKFLLGPTWNFMRAKALKFAGIHLFGLRVLSLGMLSSVG